MGIKFSNFARAKLATPPSGTAGLSFTVEAGKGALFPSYGGGDYSYVCLKNSSGTREIVKIEARTGDAFTIAAAGRGLDGTAAYGSWSTNDYAELCLPALAITEVLGLLDAHIADTTDAHDASAISYAGAPGISATDVEGAIDELAAEKLDKAGGLMTGTLGLDTGCALVFEGATSDAFETTLYVVDPTADRTITLPDKDGKLATSDGTFELTAVISPAQFTADQNDLNPTGWSTATTIRISTDAARNITGLAGGATGRFAILENVGSNNAVLKNESSGSSASNRFALGADITIPPSQAALLHYDATSSRWRAIAWPSLTSMITMGTVYTTTGGTAIDMTGIPSGCKRIIVMLSGISTNGTSTILFQTGDSGGIEITGYNGSSEGGGAATAWSSGALVTRTTVAAQNYTVLISLTRIDAANTWLIETRAAQHPTGVVYHGVGNKQTSSDLDRFRMTTSGGTDTFDAMAINYFLEF